MADPIVTIKQGQLKGVTDTDLNGDEYFKFLGIPYAKPPVGPLRFKAPQPAEPWTGIRNAIKEGSPAFGQDMFTMKTVGTEDCLYLNVFTKELPKPSVTPKPVMFFIHGGGFSIGDGGETMQGAKYLVAENVVLVTVNYRLGVLGFLSSDDLSLGIPGNAGLKDQTFALKWVHENISSFNGDPNNVTIFGVSAGGASVHFQFLSPTAKGLFHKAIAQSGVSLNPWAWGRKNAIQVAAKLGKTVSSDKEALSVLMDAPATELFEASLKIPDELLNAHIRRPFGPVIEKPNPTAFLAENPAELLSTGKFNQVPIIYGLCSNEGLIGEFRRDGLTTYNPKEIGAFWSLGDDKDKQAKIRESVNKFYFRNGESREAHQELVGDVGFLVGIVKSVILTAETSRSPVYLYVFDYTISSLNKMFELLGIEGSANFKGVSHGGDQAFLFNSRLVEAFPNFDINDQERVEAVRKVTKIWSDFARTGKPHRNWLPVSHVDELKYFHITEDPKLKVGPFEERVKFWETIFEEVPYVDARIQENSDHKKVLANVKSFS